MSNRVTVYDIITPPFRVSYPKLVAPGKLSNKYEVDCLFEPNVDTTTLWNAVSEVFTANALPQNTPYLWLKDGNTKLNKAGEAEEHYAGKQYMTLRSATPIECCIQNAQGEKFNAEPKEIYGGCYCVASISCYVYDTPSIGVSFAINFIMKIGDGESFGGGVHTAQQAFSNMGNVALPAGAVPVNGTTQADQAAPAPQQQPVQQQAAPAPQQQPVQQQAAPAPQQQPVQQQAAPAPQQQPVQQQAAPAPQQQPVQQQAAPAPAPPAPVEAAQTTPVMTALATTSYAEYIKAGWSDERLIADGYMEAFVTSFMQ